MIYRPNFIPPIIFNGDAVRIFAAERYDPREDWTVEECLKQASNGCDRPPVDDSAVGGRAVAAHGHSAHNREATHARHYTV